MSTVPQISLVPAPSISPTCVQHFLGQYYLADGKNMPQIMFILEQYRVLSCTKAQTRGLGPSFILCKCNYRTIFLCAVMVRKLRKFQGYSRRKLKLVFFGRDRILYYTKYHSWKKQQQFGALIHPPDLKLKQQT